MKKTKLTIICILFILVVIGLAVAQLTEDKIIKETKEYKITKATLDKKEALHFELKEEVLATDLIKEAIKIQWETKKQ